MSVWSPSSVNDFMACPRMWKLKRMGALGRTRDESASEKGTQFHEAMAAYWDQAIPIGDWPCPISDDPSVDRAVYRVVTQEGLALAEQGIVGVEVNLDGNDAEAARHGRYPGTCDLITDNGVGLSITDYKSKKNLDAKYVDSELRETQRSWQLKQYGWFAQLKYSRPVTHVRKLLVAFGPSLRVWLATYPITQQELSAWHTQATRIWALMDEIEALASYEQTWQNDDSCERYTWQYRCDFYHNCWDGAPIEYKET